VKPSRPAPYIKPLDLRTLDKKSGTEYSDLTNRKEQEDLKMALKRAKYFNVFSNDSKCD
jgi:hypothetical protein